MKNNVIIRTFYKNIIWVSKTEQIFLQIHEILKENYKSSALKFQVTSSWNVTKVWIMKPSSVSLHVVQDRLQLRASDIDVM